MAACTDCCHAAALRSCPLLLHPLSPRSLQMLCSEWKGTQLVAAHPRRHIMPLSAEPPGLQVLHDLPRIGTALPVVMDPAAVPRTGLPEVGDWVKIKVVGVTAVQVSHEIRVGLWG